MFIVNNKLISFYECTLALLCYSDDTLLESWIRSDCWGPEPPTPLGPGGHGTGLASPYSHILYIDLYYHIVRLGNYFCYIFLLFFENEYPNILNHDIY